MKDKKREEKRGRCLECGRILPVGRRDMKYCSVSCKSKYHYRKDDNFRALKLRTLRAIDRNYIILDQLLGSGVTSIDIPDLVLRGYHPGLVTAYSRVRCHNECRCFNIRFFLTETRIFGLSKTRIQLLDEEKGTEGG